MPSRVGNFEIVRHIASGGMGHVYLGRHVFLGKAAAIKVLRPDLPNRAQLVEMLKQEARSLARLDHPNVVQVIDIGQHEGTDFIAMDHAPGLDLARLIRRSGALEPELIHRIAWQMLAGIGAAHAAGVLHRDIKPDNVIVDGSGLVKITDFGLAGDIRMVAAGFQRQQHATPAYAAPEVLRGWRSDQRSDLFAIAATLYHAATGLLPFGSASRSSVLVAQKQGTQHIRELAPGLSTSLANTIMAALDADHEKRPTDAIAMLNMSFPSGAPAKRLWRPWMWMVGTGVAAALLLAGILWAAGVFKPPMLPPILPPITTVEPPTSPDPTQPQPYTIPTTAMGALVYEAREQRAAREWVELLESLPPNERLSPGPEAAKRVLAYARRQAGTAASSEATKLLAVRDAEVLAELEAKMTTPVFSGGAVLWLRSLQQGDKRLADLATPPSESWLKQWRSTVEAAQAACDAQLLQHADAALVKLDSGDMKGAHHEMMFASMLLLNDSSPYSPAAIKQHQATYQRVSEALSAGQRAEASKAHESRLDSLRHRGNIAARTLDAVQPLLVAAGQGLPSASLPKIRELVVGFDPIDQPLLSPLVTTIEQAQASLNGMSEFLAKSIGNTIEVRVLLRDGGGVRTDTGKLLSIDGLMLTIGGIGGVPRTEISIHQLHHDHWFERIPVAPPTMQATHWGQLAHLLSLRGEHRVAATLADLVPSADAWACTATRAAEPAIQHLALVRSLALLHDDRPIPPAIAGIVTSPIGKSILDAARLMASPDSAITPLDAAAFADTFAALPAGSLDPVTLARLLSLLPSANDLANALFAHVPTDPVAAVVIASTLNARATPPTDSELAMVRRASEANPLNLQLEFLVKQLSDRAQR